MIYALAKIAKNLSFFFSNCVFFNLCFLIIFKQPYFSEHILPYFKFSTWQCVISYWYPFLIFVLNLYFYYYTFFFTFILSLSLYISNANTQIRVCFASAAEVKWDFYSEISSQKLFYLPLKISRNKMNIFLPYKYFGG